MQVLHHVGRRAMEVVQGLRPQQPETLSAACEDYTTVEGDRSTGLAHASRYAAVND